MAKYKGKYKFGKIREKKYEIMRTLGIKSRKSFIKYEREQRSARAKVRYYKQKLGRDVLYSEPMDVPKHILNKLKKTQQELGRQLTPEERETIIRNYNAEYQGAIKQTKNIKKASENDLFKETKASFREAIKTIYAGSPYLKDMLKIYNSLSNKTIAKILRENKTLAKAVDYIKKMIKQDDEDGDEIEDYLYE